MEHSKRIPWSSCFRLRKHLNNLSGTGDEHPRFGKNTYVGQTSSMIAFSV